jgi:two-component system, sensor histidine kinase LadS
MLAAFWLAISLLAGTALTAANITAHAALDELPLDRFVEYIEDPTGRLQLRDMVKANQMWRQNDERGFNQGYTNSAWWLRVGIDNPQQHGVKRLLEIGYALLDSVDVYVTCNGELQKTYHTGDKQPYNTRALNSRFFVLPLQFEPQQTLTLYLRIQSTGTVQAPLKLWDYPRFVAADAVSNILQGIYYGGMLVIAAYNLLLFLALRERSYLYYVGFVVSTPMLVAAISGQAFRYLWPAATQWNDVAITVFMASATVFGIVFARRFLRINEISPRLGQSMGILAAVSFANGMLSFVLPYHISIQIGVTITLLVCSTAIGAGVCALRQSQTSAKIYLVAWCSFLVGAFALAANKMGLLPSNLFTEYAIQAGSMIEVVLLSFALAERINRERRLRFDAQNERLLASQRMNQELEQRVLQRTQELETLNQCLQTLSDTDPLTQLKNRRALESQLAQEWAHAVRYRHSLALVLIDIDHFKSINDRHGHPVGDICLQEVAKMIAAGMRWPGDTFARYGGEEFCLLLPETAAEEATRIVEAIREHIATAQIKTAAATIRITISAGLFVAIPQENLPAEAFIREADIALYQSKQAGRNRVTVLCAAQR